MSLLHLLERLVFVYVFLSFQEYAGHRWLLHKMRMANRCRSRWLATMCLNHMALHHKKPYNHDCHQRDDNPWQLLLSALVLGLPVAVVICFFIDPTTVKLLGLTGAVYALLLYTMHLQMHLGAGFIYARLPPFRWLERRHRLHHAFPNRNFNVILPLFDWLFGTEVCLAAAKR